MELHVEKTQLVGYSIKKGSGALRTPSVIIILITLFLIAFGCAQDGENMGASLDDARDDANSQGDKPDPDPGDSDDDDDDETPDDWDCDTGAGCACTDDYLAFPDVAREFAAPITEQQLDDQVDAIQAGQVEVISQSQPIPQAQFRQILIDAMNVGFLQQGLELRPLEVWILRESRTATYFETELLFLDPYIGDTKGLLLMPKTGGPFPGIVAIHGHTDSAYSFRDDYYGDQYPAHGYAILMMFMRVDCGGEAENEVSRALLLSGFSFMAIRSYETMLARKYLSSLAQVDPDRIGLVGHSGGSTANNLTLRIDPGFKACVSDNGSDYLNLSMDGSFKDETTPALYPYHELISNFTTAPIPVKRVDYAFVNGFDEVVDFFDEHLK